MNILNDEDAKEIHRVLCATVGADYLTIAKAASDFTIKKLAAGVSVEPDGWRTQEYIGAPSQQEPYYNADTFNTAIAAARVQAINDCAEELDGMKCNNKTATSAIKQCAEAIRALLGKEQS